MSTEAVWNPTHEEIDAINVDMETIRDGLRETGMDLCELKALMAQAVWRGSPGPRMVELMRSIIENHEAGGRLSDEIIDKMKQIAKYFDAPAVELDQAVYDGAKVWEDLSGLGAGDQPYSFVQETDDHGTPGGNVSTTTYMIMDSAPSKIMVDWYVGQAKPITYSDRRVAYATWCLRRGEKG